eukprot:SAG11_NODE_27105_length_336_cov_7.628692_1_plen_84_part_10
MFVDRIATEYRLQAAKDSSNAAELATAKLEREKAAANFAAAQGIAPARKHKPKSAHKPAAKPKAKAKPKTKAKPRAPTHKGAAN